MKKFFDKMLSRVTLHRVLLVVFVILATLVFALSGICKLYAPLINEALGITTSTNTGTSEDEDTYFYKSSYDSLEDMYKAKVSLLRDIGREGAVLLKNENGALPVKGNKVAVLNEAKGLIYESTNAGGTIKIRHDLCASLSDGLRLNGKTVTESVDGLTAEDTVIVVLGRASGEAVDISAEKLKLTDAEKTMLDSAIASPAKTVLLLSGDFSLEIAEYANKTGIDAVVKFGNAGFRGAYGLADVITGSVSPSGRLVETMAVDNASAPAAVNSGNFEFTNKQQLKLNNAQTYLVYGEGVYVDYKYYETRYEDAVLERGNATSAAGVKASTGNWNYDSEVLYPFGYGLSYTSFSKEIDGDPVYDDAKDVWKINVNVTNTGDVPGKEVVQVYAQAPYTQYDITNKVEKPAVTLVGFGKTDTLQPQASESVEIEVRQQWLASYDYLNAKSYIMDAGDYYLSVGNGAHEAVENILAVKKDGFDKGDATLVKKIVPDINATEDAPDKDIYEYIYNDKVKVTNSFDDVDLNHWLDAADKITYLTRNDWNGTYPVAYAVTASESMKKSLNEKKKMDNNVIDTASRAKVTTGIKYKDNKDYVSNTAIVFDMMGKSYDDPGWEKILDELSIQQMSFTVSNGRYSVPALKSVSFPEMPGNDNPTGLWVKYKYKSIDPKTGKGVNVDAGTALKDGITDDAISLDSLWASMFSSEPVLGATFSCDLARRQGDMFAEDALYCGQTFVWGLGLNLHRHAYGGRAAEYFSADPVHSALLAEKWSKAALDKGCIMVSKHFVANEQEQNRYGVSTFMTEQTLRETYLRAFEGPAVYGDMKGIMASYNRIGLISAAAEYDLMTKVLREEWGFDGYAITDLYSITEGLYVGKEMVIAGMDIMLGTGYAEESGSYVQKSLNVASIKASDQLLTAVRESCHRLMYVFVNSSGMNGKSRNTRVMDVTPFYIPLLITLEVLFTVLAVGFGALYVFALRRREKQNSEVRNG